MKAGPIALTPRVHGVGGMVSFRDKLAEGLKLRGYQTTGDLLAPDLQAVLVIGGTRSVGKLARLRRRGVPIVQRLDGMNWLHRRLPTGLRHWMRAEIGNWLLNLIRRRLTDRIVYQSRFSRQWWHRVYGEAASPSQVIHNAVDLQRYHPDGPHDRPSDHYRLLLVEGSLQGGYEVGLQNAVSLASLLRQDYGLNVRLVVAGGVSPLVKSKFSINGEVPVDWLGIVPREDIPRLDRSSHLLFSSDLNAACPNSVIEALACGLPVSAFETGALAELVGPTAGAITPYGGDPWQLEPPDLGSLAVGAAAILEKQEMYRAEARARALALFDKDLMVEKYLKVLL